MKVENAIFVVAIVLIAMIIIRNVAPKKDKQSNTTEENKVAYRYEIEDQNFTDINQNIVEASSSSINVQNVIDVSSIEELRREGNQ